MNHKKRFTQDEAVGTLRKELERSGLNFSDFAKSKGVSKQYLRNVMVTKIQLPGPKVGFEKDKDSIRFVRI